ncbi:MAG TPA: efflux transporter outer membrane subunit [bacterium]|nr:efflux transporter outer membrane subunit [bacterium]HPR87687.1 efflux transporter outer membrane subunit [bacterium]
MINHHPSSFLRIMAWSAAMFALWALSGCAVLGPKYTRPATELAGSWHTELAGGLTSAQMEAQSLASWWRCFNDAELDSLIGRATRNNPSVKQAQSRIRESRARRGNAAAGFAPTVSASGSARTGKTTGPAGGSVSSESYSAGFDAGWEIDLFGGLRKSYEASSADLQASQEDLRDVMVSLLAEVASDYVELRLYQARLGVAEANLTAQDTTWQLIQWRHQAGLSDELALQQARANLENTRSQIPTLKTGLEGVMNSLAVLLGEQPGKLHAELAAVQPVPVAALQVAVGVPADMLRRRPDIRQAERQLAAQTARVGVARAELLPKFNLSGSIGLEALSLGKLFSTNDTETSSGSALVSWPIFKAGSLRRNIQIASEQQQQYLLSYESTVLKALEEVENALVAFANEQQRKESLSLATDAAQRAAELAQLEYKAGMVDFTTVLDSQRSLLSFQDQLAQCEGTVSTNLIHLYKVLGGGWSALVPE